MAGASRIWKFVKNKLLRVEEEKNIYDVDLPFFNHHKKNHSKLRASCSRPPCVPPPFAVTCSFRSPITITRSPQSLACKPPTSSRLRVFVFVCCVMCTYLSTCPFRLACCDRLLLLAVFLAAPSQPNTYWWRRWCARSPNALASGRPPRAPSTPSPPSSQSRSVRLQGCLSSLSSPV